MTARRELLAAATPVVNPSSDGTRDFYAYITRRLCIFFTYHYRLPGRCALKHRKIRREILRVRRREARQRCSFFVHTGARTEQSPDPPALHILNKGAVPARGCAHSRPSFSSRIPVCQSGDAGATPSTSGGPLSFPPRRPINRACHNFHGECPGQRIVNPPSPNRPEATSGALPPFPTIFRNPCTDRQTSIIGYERASALA